MSLRLHHQSPPSSSNALVSPSRTCVSNKNMVDLDQRLFNWGYSRKRCRIKLASWADGNLSLNYGLVDLKKNYLTLFKSRRHCFPFASDDDGVTVNGSPQPRTSSNVEEIRIKLDQSLQNKDYSDDLVQSLHDAARAFELAIKEESTLFKLSWFSTAWLGVDKNAWVKALSYQASVYALLQAATEISSRGDARDRDINVFVQRSLLRQSGLLESVIRDKLSTKQPEAYEWFWSEQVPTVMTTFVNYFESDPRFTAATAVSRKGFTSGSANDISLLMLALSCIAAITKLGPTKISCSQFFSMIPDVTGRLMEMVLNFLPIRQAYHSIKDIGLRREFLVHFGPQAAACRVKNDQGIEEVVFWVSLVQKQLQRAIDREKIWSRLTTCESIEVLERDLAIFGFFIALGRSTQSFLSANGFDDINEPIEGFLRYLIGGSVLYYPQLSSISSYQLYVEVVCEELEWLPFYSGITSTSKRSNSHIHKREGPPNAEAIPQVLDVCSHWIQSFIKYSKWLENPSNVKAARFLSRGHNKLKECMEDLGMHNNEMGEGSHKQSVEKTRSGTYSLSENELDSSFDKALENVEEALIRLEELLQELHVSSSSSGKEQLKAACSDLERMRKLKKEAEFLEASFRAKAASLQQGDDDNSPSSSTSEKQQWSKGKNRKTFNIMSKSNPRGLWNFLVRNPARRSDSELSAADGNDDTFEKSSSVAGLTNSQSNEIQRFELLRNELIELEKRVQRSADRSANEEEEMVMTVNSVKTADGHTQLASVRKKENLIEKSFDKLKETST
ncbi:uncharacterized protein LOC127789350 isoform X3 [Diospyros lotus]|nr:uncharacterized protein LOC127789350 isoform X3 [Diospyros lotus]